MPMQDYNEPTEFRRYLWTQFSVICTEAERRVYKANLGRQKAENSPSQDRMLRKMFGDWDEASIATELREGFDSFTDRVLQRIDGECPELLYINRCEACGRIVATPKACICGWCGHEWFSRRDEQEKTAEDAFDRAKQKLREQARAGNPLPAE
jgi:hypothetical protein